MVGVKKHGFAGRVNEGIGFPAPGELTQIKCYPGWEVDEESADTLTHIHGYRSPDYEFVLQTGV
ncbi:MAG: hypothetical protein ABSF60_02335, partial [Verrucomicrobiota bacterium]